MSVARDESITLLSARKPALWSAALLFAVAFSPAALAADTPAADSNPSQGLNATAGSTESPTAPAAATSPSIYDEDPATTVAPPIPDKIEGFNRAIFKFNDGLYRFTLRPISRGYSKVVPLELRRGFGKFFHNLAFPTRFVGNVLEGRIRDAGVETGRFVINSVTSLGFDTSVADDIHGFEERPSDLGQAFATWGIGHGTYLVLPLLGPSSVRDGVGQGISGYFLDPVHYVQEWEVRTGVTVFTVVNESPDLMNNYDQLKAASIDPYIALRDAYSSRRARRTSQESIVPVVPAATSAATPGPTP